MCCCFQTFKDLLALSKPPFCWGCKGKSLYFLSQNYLKKFQTFFAVKIVLRTTVFFKRTAKISAYFLVPNFIWFFIFSALIVASMNFRFCRTGGEDKSVHLTSKFYFKFFCFYFAIHCNCLQRTPLFLKAGGKDKSDLFPAKSFSVRLMPKYFKPLPVKDYRTEKRSRKKWG